MGFPGRGPKAPRSSQSSSSLGGTQKMLQFREFGCCQGVRKFGENQKGTAGRAREKKCHDNLRQTSRPPGPKPSSTESLTTGFNSLSDKALPTPSPNGPLAPSYGGSHLMHLDACSMASACRVRPSSRPGRPRHHIRQLAELPRGDPVSA